MAININKKGDKLIWKIDEEIKPNTLVIVDEGICGLLIYQGGILNIIYPGEQKVLNQRGFLERLFRGRGSKDYALYGVNTGKQIELKWGTTKSSDYKDEEYGIVLNARCFGMSTVRIENPQLLFNSLSDKDDLTDEKLSETIKTKLCAACTDALVQVALEKKDRFKIEASKLDVAEAMKEAFKKNFGNELGLEHLNTTVLGITVTGFEAIDKKKSVLAEEKVDTEISEEKKLQALDSVEVLDKLNKATAIPNNSNSQSSKKPQDNSEKSESTKSNHKFCIYCGEKLPILAQFCNNCGKHQ